MKIKTTKNINKIKYIFTIILTGVFLTFYFTFPYALNLNVNFYENPDFYINSWTYWYTSSSVLNGLFFNISKFFDTYHLYPFPSTLAQQDFSLIPSTLLYLPYYIFTKNHIFSTNIAIFSAFVLNFASSFIFFKKTFKNNLNSLLGAMVFTFAPNMVRVMGGHIEYLNRFFIPPFFYYLFLFYKKPDKNNSLWLFFIYSLQWFTNIQLSIFLTLMAFFAFVAKVTINLLHGKKIKELVNLLKFSVVSLFFIPFIYVYFSPYLEYSTKEGISRSVSETSEYSAKPLDFLLPFTNSKLYIHFFQNNLHPKDFTEKTHNPGYLALLALFILIFYKIINSFKQKGRFSSLEFEWFLYLFLLTIAVILSLGPYLNIGDKVVTMPYYYIYKAFPLLGATRTPARLEYVWIYFVAYLLVYGLNQIVDSRKKNIITVSLIILLMLEYKLFIPINAYRHIPIDFDLTNKKVLFIPIETESKTVNDSRFSITNVENKYFSINGHTGSEYTMLGYFKLMYNLKNYYFLNYWFNVLNTLNISYIVIDKEHIYKYPKQYQQIVEYIDVYKSLTVYENNKWLVFDTSKYTGPLEKVCDSFSYDNLEIKYALLYNQTTKDLYLEYKTKNISDCNIAFLYQNRYLKFEYSIVNNFNNHSTTNGYILFEPVLLKGAESSEKILLKHQIANPPESINLKVLDKNFNVQTKIVY